MDQQGLIQVKERLSRLQAAADLIASSPSLYAQESAWLDFLLHHGTVYSKLEQAAKATSKGYAWFNKKKKERKDDPLLSYLHHARNAGEHTIIETASKAEFSVTGTLAHPDGTLELAFDNNGKPYAVGKGMNNVMVHRNEIMLCAAKDRGQYYQAPREHLGQAIEGQTAREVAALALEHAVRMIAEAETFVCPK